MNTYWLLLATGFLHNRFASRDSLARFAARCLGFAGNLRLVVVGASLAFGFEGAARAQSISGHVLTKDSLPVPGVTITVTKGLQIAATNTDASGHYAMNLGATGTYAVTPSKAGSAFTPASTNVTFLSGSQSATLDFGTDATAPVATTQSAQNVQSINATLSATLTGLINPGGASSTAYFAYGPTTNYGSFSSTNNVAGGIVNVAVSIAVTGLTNGNTYHYRLVGDNRYGEAVGTDATFSAPVVTLLGAAAMTNECHAIFTDPGATNTDGLQVYETGSVDINSPGTYLRTYTVTNNGATGIVTRTVTIVDTTGPIITILGANPLYLAVNSTFEDPGATAFDACSGVSAVTTNGVVNSSVVGNYTISYSSGDNYSNTTTVMRTVAVKVPLTVTTINDSGTGSLRETIANSSPGDYITFAGFLSEGTIQLTSQLTVSNDLTIDASALPAGIQSNGLLGGILINGNGKLRIFNVTSNAAVVLTSLTITNGSATNDGSTPNGGGGILNAGTLILNHCNIWGNKAADTGNGGGILNTGTLTLNQCTLTGNFAYSGGGIYNTGTISAINQCTLTANNADIDGGGIYNYGTVTAMNQCTITGSICNNGGGIYNAGPMTVNQCTITGNIAETVETGGGGSAINDVRGPLAVNQSTITGNALPFDGIGGISIDNDDDVSICNSIVAENGGKDIDAPNDFINFSGANIVQNLGAGVFINGPTPITNAPLLAVLGNYGGPTQTMPPLPGSPAVDGCTNGTSFTNYYGIVFPAFTTDQRGFLRPLGLATDIGAVEGIYNAAGPGLLTGVTRLGNGSTIFAFTNFTDTSFTVLASANVASPIGAWTNLGPAVESPVGSGQFQFTDPQARNFPQRFYRVHTP